MEILTLLKANFRRKKGTFISILLLTAIVASMTVSIFSVRENYQTAMETAFEESGSGDIIAIINVSNLTDELRDKLENSELIERVECFDAVVSDGIYSDEHEDSNAQIITTMRDGIKLFNESLSGFETEIPELQRGEIYLPLGLKPELECDIGDKVNLRIFSDETAEFEVRGFVQEPGFGSMTIGIKQVFISDEDFNEFHEKNITYESGRVRENLTLMNVFQSPDSDLSAAKLQRKLNLETKFSDLSWLAFNKDQIMRYSTLMPEIVLDIVLAFVVFLFVIILIIMSHSISTEIEIDYVTLGIMKSQGFTKDKIRVLFLFQYLLAQTVGLVIGVIVAVPLEMSISNIFQLVTAVLPDRGVSIVNCLIVTALILLISAVLIVIKTRKIAGISPIRAISGGREEIYFDSRLNAPIFKKALSASLSLRQFTSAKMRYIGTIFIATLLTFSMITVNLIGVLLSSDEALRAMGLEIMDVAIQFDNDKFPSDWEETDRIVGSYSDIEEKNSQTTGYASIDGENLYFQAYESPEYIKTMKGRSPNYDNEIVITEMVGDMLEIDMGDEVTVSYGDKDGIFIVSGIYQSGSDSGMAFAMGFEAAEKIGINTSKGWRYYILEDRAKDKAISDELKERYGDDVKIILGSDEENSISAEYDTIVTSLKGIIYSFSLIFAFVVVGMVCSRMFTQERTDIGIFKAIGFTSRKLRFGFAGRFMIVAVIGSALGIVMSILLSAKMLGAIFSLIGISHIVLEFTPYSVFVPVITLCLSFAVFAYVASWKVKKVAVRELVTE